jgi:hypothetical protein
MQLALTHTVSTVSTGETQAVVMGTFHEVEQAQALTQALASTKLYERVRMVSVTEFYKTEPDNIEADMENPSIKALKDTPKKPKNEKPKVLKSFKELKFETGVEKLDEKAKLEILELRKTPTVDRKAFYLRRGGKLVKSASSEKEVAEYLDAEIVKLKEGAEKTLQTWK